MYVQCSVKTTSIPACQLLKTQEGDLEGAQQKATRENGGAPTPASARRPTTAAAANAPAATISPNPSPPDPMTTAAEGEPPLALPLGPLLGNLPTRLFQREVLRRLGPTALASLAGAGRGCAAPVAATALLQWANHTKVTPLGHLGLYLLPLGLKEACSRAARCGKREVLEWLHNTGCPWSGATCSAAAIGGHLDVLQYAREHGCPWDVPTCAYAARSEHLRMLQWAREHHCPWNCLTPAWAAEGGNMAVLQWAREHHCPWNSYTCQYAAHAGHLEVLQWMRENDSTGEVWSEWRARTFAGEPRMVEVLTWLDQLSAP